MGCNIHLAVQVRVPGADPDEWTNTDFKLSRDRNYPTFALYAGVRNAGDYYPPISKPRGFPPTGCDYLGYDFGDHSFSWLTLAELEEAWEQLGYILVSDIGTLTKEQYLDYKLKNIQPTTWTNLEWEDHVAGVKVVNYDDLITGKVSVDSDWTHVKNCVITSPIRDSAYLFRKHLAELNQVADTYKVTDHNDIRIIFGFDN